MTPAVVLAILVSAGEAHSAASAAMETSAIEVVGAPEAVRLVEAAALDDAEALRVERALGVRAVVQLAWGDTDHLRARLRLHASRTDRWIDREFGFTAADTLAERGRALGFAMASMLPEGDPSLPLAAKSEPAAPEMAAAPPGPNALEAAFVAGAGLGGPAGGFGGSLDFERFVTSSASLDVGLAGRLGNLGLPTGRVLTTSLGVGGALWPLAPTGAQRLGVAVRGEAALVYEAVSHTTASGVTTWRGDVLPGGALTLAGTFRMAGPLELVVAGGAELVFGTVDVTVVATGSRRGTATLPAARALAEAGVRARF